MQVLHEEFGLGHLIPTTEVLDEEGYIVSSDVMFEHGIVHDVSAEDLQELSYTTLKNYSRKASAELGAIASKRGRKSAADHKVIAKRTEGMKKSSDKQEKIFQKEYDAENAKSHAGFTHAVPLVLHSHGYTLAHPGSKSNIYTKHEPATNSLHVAKHVFGTTGGWGGSTGKLHVSSTSGTSSTITPQSTMKYRDKPVDHTAQHSEHIDRELKAHHRHHETGFNSRDMNESLDLSAFDLTEEEAEMISELSRKTLGSYVKKSQRNLSTAAVKYAANRFVSGDDADTDTEKAMKDFKKRQAGIDKATDKLTKESVEFPELTMSHEAKAKRNISMEHAIRDIMSENKDLRKENEIREFNSRKHK